MKWEYLAVSLVNDKEINLTESLNRFGETGWELVQFDMSSNLFIFKRFVSDLVSISELSTEEQTNQALEGYFGGKIG